MRSLFLFVLDLRKFLVGSVVQSATALVVVFTDRVSQEILYPSFARGILGCFFPIEG